MSPAADGDGEKEDYYDELDEDGVPRWARLIDAMDGARPDGAPLPADLCGDSWDIEEVEDWQMDAFEAGVESWWLVVPPRPGESQFAWHYADGVAAPGNA